MDSEWYDLWNGKHNTPEQKKRLERGRRAECTPISISPEGIGTFSGYHGVYTTDLTQCSCPDFQSRQLPCKHMYRLAIEVGCLNYSVEDDETRIISPSSYSHMQYDDHGEIHKADAASFILDNPPLYQSSSGGFANYSVYKIKGTFPATNRVRTCKVEAMTEEAAIEEAENKHGLIAPYTVEIQPFPEPTENQISYALDLGFSVGDDWSRADVSCMIDRCTHNDFSPLNPIIANFATQNGVRFSSYYTTADVVSTFLRLFGDDIDKKAELYFICFCAYLNAPDIIYADKEIIAKYIALIKGDISLEYSLKRKNGDDFSYPLSTHTHIYKETLDFVRNTVDEKMRKMEEEGFDDEDEQDTSASEASVGNSNITRNVLSANKTLIDNEPTEDQPNSATAEKGEKLKKYISTYWNDLKEQPNKMIALGFAFLIIVILLLVMIGFACSSSCNEDVTIPKTDYSYNEIETDYGTKKNPEEIYDKNGVKLLSVNQLPCPITYNDITFNLAKVEYYQNVVDFSHNLFIVVTLDIRDMDDATIHRLTESDMMPFAFITCEKNGYDTKAAEYIGCLQEEKALRYVFASSFSMENRHSFGGSTVSVSLRITQEKDDYKFDYAYSSVVPETLSGTDAIAQPLNNFITKRLYEKAEALKVG